MKTKLITFLFLAISIIPGFLFGQFTQQGPKLVGTNAIGSSNQGSSVEISSDGNTAIVGGWQDNGGIGAAWVYTRSGGVWTQQGTKLVGSNAVGSSCQGISVSISSDGNTAIIGGFHDNNDTGSVWVFMRSGGVWSQQGQKLVGSGVRGVIGGPFQGTSVRISGDGNTILEGGYADSNNAGAVWVFVRNGGVWTQQGAKLVGNDANGGADQGYSVGISFDGNTIVEGGFQDNSYIGAAWVFVRSGGVWTQQGGKLVGTGFISLPADQGASVAISSDGNIIVESGFADNSGAGSIWVFTRSGGIWSQMGSRITGTGAVGSANIGFSLAISPDGNSFVAGGYTDNGQAGASWVFTRTGSVWTQLGSKLVGTGAVGNSRQGSSIAISSEGTVIVGGLFDNSQLGAAWIFSDPTIGIQTISTEVPKGYTLSQNYPNPFNPNSKIKFQIAKSGDAKLFVFDELGREVATLVNEQLNPGTYEVDFDGSKYASGIYFYALKTDSYSETKRMILLK